MQPDPSGQYRPLLEASPPPFADRVDNPWDPRIPDVANYNGRAFKRIQLGLRDVLRNRKSSGLLILGEAGTGKTHLLMRAARELGQQNHILFVRRPNVTDAVAQHVWSCMLESLARRLPAEGGGERSQLEDLMGHVLTQVLITKLREDIEKGTGVDSRRTWLRALEESPFAVFEMLGDAASDTRAQNIRLLRKWALQHIEDVDNRDTDYSANLEMSTALINYVLYVDDGRRRSILQWLRGSELSEQDAAKLGMRPSWDVDAISEESSETSIQERREAFALKAIKTIGALSTHYQPLVLAFDQLEGLRGEEELTRRWSDTVREIMTMTPNLLVVTCIFPSLWDTWFHEKVEESTRQRIAQRRVELERFGATHGTAFLSALMDHSCRVLRLPDTIFPFSEEDVRSLVEAARSPREFIQAAHEAFEEWLVSDDEELELATAVPKEVVRSDELAELIDRTLTACREHHQRSFAGDPASLPQDLFARVRAIVRHVRGTTAASEMAKASRDHYVMLPNFIVADSNGRKVCVAPVCLGGKSLTARLRNLLWVAKETQQFDIAIVYRDRHSGNVGATGRSYVKSLEKMGSVVLEVEGEELAKIHAIYDALVAVEEHDLQVRGTEVDVDRYFAHLTDHGVLAQTQLFRAIADHLPSTAQATGPVSAPNREAKVSVVGAESEEPPLRPDLHGHQVTGEQARTANHAPPSSAQSLRVPVVLGSKSASPSTGLLGKIVADATPVSVALDKPQSMVVLGHMGSGKSYALGVLIENALLHAPPVVEQDSPLTVVAFNYRRNANSRFEWASYLQPNAEQSETAVLASEHGGVPKGLRAGTVLAYGAEIPSRRGEYGALRPQALTFLPSELTAAHWQILMKPPSAQTEYMDVVRAIIADLHYKRQLTLRNLESRIQTDERLTPQQLRRAMNRLAFARSWVTETREWTWEEVLAPGTLTVVDLRTQVLQADEALKICLVVTDLVRRARSGASKLVVFDEAHEYVDSPSLVDELENAITQIRHDAMSFVFASQYPQRLPARLYKYLLTRIVFKLGARDEIDFLRKRAPNLEALPVHRVANLGLEQGVCFIQSDDDCSDETLRAPQLVRIRPRLTAHGGATKRSTGHHA